MLSDLITLWVAFSSTHEPGASTDQVIARTFGDMPDAAPQNVTLEAASSQVCSYEKL
jgi:hypothetical protein